MDRLKFRCITDAGIYHAPSDSFSVSFHDTGISLIFWSIDGFFDEIDVKSVDQFTGLKDKNGNDIYEGDIVHLFGYGRYTCEFPFTELWEAYQENDIGEILGNIHENPELMEWQND